MSDLAHLLWSVWDGAGWNLRLLILEFCYVGLFFILKAVKLQRLSSFGWSMSTNNMMQGIIYIALVVLFFAPWPREWESTIQNVLFAGLAITVTWAYYELFRPPTRLWGLICRHVFRRKQKREE